MSDFTDQKIIVTPEFFIGDVCPYILSASTVFQYDLEIELKILNINKAIVVILRGNSLNEIKSFDTLDFEGATFSLPATT